MATKNIVPRAAGEGSLGIAGKPWGVIYANSIPLVDEKLTAHNDNQNSHINGIMGNAATASKLQNPVTINGVEFDGSQSINIELKDMNFLTAEEARELYANA